MESQCTVQSLEAHVSVYGPPAVSTDDVLEIKALLAEAKDAGPLIARRLLQLMERNSELEKANDEKSRWLAAAAHDLRHPPSAILLYSDLLLEETETILNADQRAMLESIRASCDRMLLFLDLLDGAAVESRRPRQALETQASSGHAPAEVAQNRPLPHRKDTHVTDCV